MFSLTDEQRAHSQRLVTLLKDRIQKTGPVAFVDYMQFALYEPGLGYYSSGQAVLGRAGDFVTAPLLTPLFSHCLARRYAQFVAQHQQPAAILELGAGNGQMALDILLYCQAAAYEPIDYFILEPSAAMQAQQRATLSQLDAAWLERVTWLQDWPAEGSFTGCVFANEVLDAMPVHAFECRGDTILEAFVTCEQDQLQISYMPTENVNLLQEVRALNIQTDTAYRSEINLWTTGWMRSLARCLATADVVLLDYGYLAAEYYHAERTTGTLMCHFRHRAHADALLLPGCQDMTSYVDFDRVGQAACDAGLRVTAYQTQTEFLLSMGITDLLAKVTPQSAYQAQARAVKQLTLPTEMGERFKVMSLTSSL